MGGVQVGGTLSQKLRNTVQPPKTAVCRGYIILFNRYDCTDTDMAIIIGRFLNIYSNYSIMYTKVIQRNWFQCTLVQIRLHDHPHCGVRCGPHRTVRTAPALKAKKLPHNHNFPTIHFNLFCLFGKKTLKKIFPQSKKKTFLSPIFPFLRWSILLSTMHFSPK